MNSPSGLKDSEVILGGLLYPLESDSMDKSDWYSETLLAYRKEIVNLLLMEFVWMTYQMIFKRQKMFLKSCITKS